MELDRIKQEERIKLVTNVLEKHTQEQQAIAAIDTEILSKLNISIQLLPQRCQDLLHKAATCQTKMEIEKLNPIAMSLQLSHQISRNINEEYEILKLKQRDAKLQNEIDRNNRFLQNLRTELDRSRDSLANNNPNPDNIQESIKQMRQKVASYEESYKRAMAKYSKLSVPECELPVTLQAQIVALETMKVDEVQWRLQADDALFASRARDTFSRLRR